MPWSLCSIATRAYALEYIYAQRDEGLCPGLVPHAFEMLELHSQVKLHCRVKLYKMSMKLIYDDTCDAK